ncbi:hypothetical protein [Aggregatilinea lenta]|uniref:hypothetical protein n=1 Tax=Aggregatilinea lenta TaxID=913108 RepID=UPI000E5B25BC|nr:hypothetical protein [Aggregatilinea lenta]
MAEVNLLLKQATAAFQAGRVDQARTLLLSVIEKDEQNEQAWWWLSAVVETLEDQQICLENVTALNPLNSGARQGLEMVGRMIASQGRQARPAPGAPPWFAGEADSAPIGAEFDATSGDSLIDSLSDIRVKPGVSSGSAAASDDPFGSWLSDSTPESPPAPEPDSFAPATSVDWGRADRPAAYGSGKQVDLPSEEEYDNWLQGLNLGSGPAPSRAQDSVSPFVGADMPVDFPSAPPVPRPPAAPLPAPRRDQLPVIEDDPFAEYTEAGTPPTDVPTQADPIELAEDDEAFWNQNAAALTAAQTAEEQAFSFEDEGNLPRPAAMPAPRPAQVSQERPSAPSPAAAGLSAEIYYRAIPKDIAPAAGSSAGAVLLRLVGIVLLVALNIASFGFLISQLAG